MGNFTSSTIQSVNNAYFNAGFYKHKDKIKCVESIFKRLNNG